MDRNRHRRQGRMCLRKRLTSLFVWLEHQLPSLLTQTMSAKSGRHIEHDFKRSRARAKKLAKMRENRSPAGRTGSAIDPPLVVPPTTRDSTCAQYYCGQTVYVPEVGDVVITQEHIMQAETLNITVGQLLRIEDMPVLTEKEIKRICPGPTFGQARRGQEAPNENV